MHYTKILVKRNNSYNKTSSPPTQAGSFYYLFLIIMLLLFFQIHCREISKHLFAVNKIYYDNAQQKQFNMYKLRILMTLVVVYIILLVGRLLPSTTLPLVASCSSLHTRWACVLFVLPQGKEGQRLRNLASNGCMFHHRLQVVPNWCS